MLRNVPLLPIHYAAQYECGNTNNYTMRRNQILGIPLFSLILDNENLTQMFSLIYIY